MSEYLDLMQNSSLELLALINLYNFEKIENLFNVQ